jgi:hypothetical protein
VRASAGHAFLLFTSLRAMDRGFERLAQKLEAERLEWPLLLQGSGSKNELLERFRRSPNAILVGSQSFWEGVDVKGEQLSVVVIDRLPFNPPDDPVLAACIERITRAGGNAFMDYQLPRAVITEAGRGEIDSRRGRPRCAGDLRPAPGREALRQQDVAGPSAISPHPPARGRRGVLRRAARRGGGGGQRVGSKRQPSGQVVTLGKYALADSQ